MKAIFICSFLFLEGGLAIQAPAPRTPDEAKKYLSAIGMPYFNMFKKMSPQMVKTFVTVYQTTLSNEALAHLSTEELEVIYATVSAANNCEICLSFHAMAMDKSKVLLQLSSEVKACQLLHTTCEHVLIAIGHSINHGRRAAI